MFQVYADTYAGKNGKEYKISVFKKFGSYSVTVSHIYTIDIEFKEDKLRDINLPNSYSLDDAIQEGQNVADSYN